jgi:GNAT acetyltransferase-like protein
VTQVRLWSAEEFAASKVPWEELVARSDADPLFMSWDWQWRWWIHHAEVLNATLRLVAVYSADRLVGLAPFYSHAVVVRHLLRTQRLELIGTAWRDPRATFSEYLDIIADRDHRAEVVAAIGRWLAAQPYWDDLALCCSRRDSVASQLVAEQLETWTHVREVDPLVGWRAHLPASFDDYVQALAPAVRRKLFNHRRKLTEPRLVYATAGDLMDSFRVLWSLSNLRWGALPPAHVQNFQRDIATELARRGELRLSQLCAANGIRSVLYNVHKAGTVYYLQSAFDAATAHGLSPGYLHFGYAIEAACREGIRRFDFLAGRGRHRDYKQDFSTDGVPMVSYHVVRRAITRMLYVTYQLLSERKQATSRST